MTLAELLTSLSGLADDLAIYASPRWSPASEALAVREPADGTLPSEARGKTYLTSVRKARQVIAARRAWRPDRAQSDKELAEAVIYFAIYDESEPLPSVQSGEIRFAS